MSSRSILSSGVSSRQHFMPKPSKQLASKNKSAIKQRKQLESVKKVDTKTKPAVTHKISRDEAATTIALAWRRKFRFVTTIKLVQNYVSSGPTKERVKAMG
jgi:hypothetical protein